LLDIKANDYASDFVRRKIAEQVTDPVVRDRLTPKNCPFGTKRPSVDSSYVPTFNRPNVTLADVREDPIVEITPTGIRTESTHYDLDVIVYATGFDVFTGSLLAIDIQGRDAMTLRDKWSEGPRTYLGLMTSDFPNLFMVAGPGSPSLLSNVIVSTEAHVDLIAELIAHADAAGVTEIEPTDEAVTDWVKHVNEKAQETLYPLAKSYYNGDEIEGKPRVFMPYSGGVRGYRRILSKVVENGYEGFSLRSERPVEVAST
jgi:cyclohexanone monooxygenase